jgi:pimeloyl-ACP methyl ester carboxylesterase
MRNYYRANLAASGIGKMPPVTVPVLMMYGTRDGLVPPRYYDLSAAHAAASCEIVPIQGGGHFIHYDSAARVTSELVRWLREAA